jgi:hypothetical protein
MRPLSDVVNGFFQFRQALGFFELEIVINDRDQQGTYHPAQIAVVPAGPVNYCGQTAAAVLLCFFENSYEVQSGKMVAEVGCENFIAVKKESFKLI